jgi:hypothetical protein
MSRAKISKVSDIWATSFLFSGSRLLLAISEEGAAVLPRPYGTGSVYQQGASWYQNGKRIKRKIGPIRHPGSRDGLTEKMAGKRLQRLML